MAQDRFYAYADPAAEIVVEGYGKHVPRWEVVPDDLLPITIHDRDQDFQRWPNWLSCAVIDIHLDVRRTCH